MFFYDPRVLSAISREESFYLSLAMSDLLEYKIFMEKCIENFIQACSCTSSELHYFS